eukprot:CAMPEP_0206410174 /NCGR_PEP_ID=MMETSP0294-20121207/32418_1 /ASSEMBLY_ACC=CAM_ASM_000327 /TAXON_ID=39354 /ORGANISM="Heterosigma akashiwo, Strain CCMP2393" /LENGTH=91 /DNA_ID=CAMNT_0053870435 /DNA_START=67 /DNA_END=339 /DNA_ORIENTATION=-
MNMGMIIMGIPLGHCGMLAGAAGATGAAATGDGVSSLILLGTGAGPAARGSGLGRRSACPSTSAVMSRIARPSTSALFPADAAPAAAAAAA